MTRRTVIITACQPRTSTASRTSPTWPTCRRGRSATTSPRGCCRRRGQVGPGAHYTDGHLARLRLIRRLQREHLPLAEIRTRLADARRRDDRRPGRGRGTRRRPTARPSTTSGRSSVRGDAARPTARPLAGRQPARPRRRSGKLAAQLLRRIEPAAPSAEARGTSSVASSCPPNRRRPHPPPPSPPPSAPSGTASTLTPDIELNIRRPLSRQQNKRVERLIAIARELLEEDPS